MWFERKRTGCKLHYNRKKKNALLMPVTPYFILPFELVVLRKFGIEET